MTELEQLKRENLYLKKQLLETQAQMINSEHAKVMAAIQELEKQNDPTPKAE
jgi:hypothetical protein